MTNRAGDWLAQAERDLRHAERSRSAGEHEWACFAAHQAAEKAVKALHLHLGQDAWGHVVADLIEELPVEVPEGLTDQARVLDTSYIPATSRLGARTAIPKVRRSSTTVRSRARKGSGMPVRSLRSRVLRWPDRHAVHEAVRAWAAGIAARDELARRIGYFGSYARGDWGVGSDVDLVVVVDRSGDPFERRSLSFDATRLPVPADVLVYTVAEWERMSAEGGLPRTVGHEVVWVFER